MPANYNTRVTQEEREAHLQKQQNVDIETGDAAVQYYNGKEMSKLTDSEGEFQPADDEWRPSHGSTVAASSNMDRLQSFFDDSDDDGSGFFFSDEEDANVIKSKNLKVQRDLAEGQNLNNSFG